MLALSAIGFGLSPLFDKMILNAGIASPAITFYRFLLATVLLLPMLTFSSTKRFDTLWGISGGLVAALGRIAYLEALKSVPVATVGVIYYTYPLFTVLLAILLLRQLPHRRSIFAGLLTIIAALLAFSPTSVGISQVKPLLLLFLTPLTFAFFVIVTTNKTAQLNPMERLSALSLGGVLGMLPIVLSLDTNVVIPQRLEDWYPILGLSILVYLIPNWLYSIAAPFVGPARASITGSLGLPTMFVIGWLVFGEQITMIQLSAALLVLIAIYITPTRSSKSS